MFITSFRFARLGKDTTTLTVWANYYGSVSEETECPYSSGLTVCTGTHCISIVCKFCIEVSFWSSIVFCFYFMSFMFGAHIRNLLFFEQ